MLYPDDFTQQEKLYLGMQAQHYELDAAFHPEMKNLCQEFETKKKIVYFSFG